MKILTKENSIISSTNLLYFDTHTNVSPAYSTESHWRRAEEDSYILTYSIVYGAGDQTNDDYFINYTSKLSLKCKIDDIETDVDLIMDIKENMHIPLKSFLEDNSSHYFHLLNFKPMIFLESDREREKNNISRAMMQTPYEDLTQEGKMIEKTIFNSPLLKVKLL